MRVVSLGIICLLVPAIGNTQTVSSKGNGNANVGVNNSWVIVNNFRMPRAVARQLGADSPGTLIPGHNPTDFGSCKDFFGEPSSEEPALKESLVISYGGSVGACLSFPCKILQANGEDIITLVSLNGSIGVKAEFPAADGKMIASIEGNVVHVNQNEAWYVERPDIHTMKVVDQYNRETLWVSFENKHFVRLRTKLADADNVYLEVGDHETVVGGDNGLKTSGNCNKNVAGGGPALLHFQLPLHRTH